MEPPFQMEWNLYSKWNRTSIPNGIEKWNKMQFSLALIQTFRRCDWPINKANLPFHGRRIRSLSDDDEDALFRLGCALSFCHLVAV
jgi:hypothetical protein